jgi:integrase
MTSPKGPKPRRPKDCPLFAHASGTWAKTIDGKHKHFGPWHDLPGAMKRWEAFDSARKAGREPRPVPNGSITLRQLVNRYLTFHHARALAGQIAVRSFQDLKGVAETFVEEFGPSLPVQQLAPDNFSAYHAKLTARYGVHALKRTVTLVKQIFRWGYENDLIDRPVKYGPSFKGQKKEKVAERRRRKDKSFTPGEVRKMIDLATIPLRAMILLGVNAGFGNTDIGTLEWADVDLDAAVIDTHRHKTGIPRRCTLWPETVAALREVKALKRRGDGDDADIVFLNQNGTRYVREVVEMKDGVIARSITIDAIPQEFARLLGKAGVYKMSSPKKGRPRPVSDGRGFYCLRRTHRTWADEMKDPPAAARLMGHGDESMAGVYVQRIGDDRLKAITDHLRSKVFT